MRTNLQGSIFIARKIIESDVFFKKPAEWFKIWMFILLMANHEDNKHFKRGECFTSYDEIAHHTGSKKNTVDHCMRWLKAEQQINTRKATRGMYINIVNYEVYQDLRKTKSETEAIRKRHFSKNIEKTGDTKSDTEIANKDIQGNTKSNKEDLKSDTKSDLEAIQKRYRGDTINKNEKNEKETVAEATPYVFENEIEKLRNSDRNDFKIIALYWKKKEWKFENRNQFNSSLRRELKPAKSLEGYSGQEIGRAIAHCIENFSKIGWTLETVGKRISDVINKK